MKRKLLSIVLLLTLVFNKLAAQVNLQSGSCQETFSLYNYFDSRSGLSTSIKVGYVSGNGIKVNQIANNVGLGWALEAGGFIERIQNGEPDDQDSRVSFPPVDICTNQMSFNASNAFALGGTQHTNYVDNYYPNGYLFTEYPVADGLSSCAIPGELAIAPRFTASDNKRWKLSRRASADRMQDLFIFNFNGRSGSFYIGRDGSFLILPDSKLKIEMIQSDMTSQNIRTKISEFFIIDEAGIKYRFNALELSQTLTNQVTSDQVVGNINFRTYNANQTGKYTVQKWFLTEIINPRTNEKITIQYVGHSLDIISNVEASLTVIDQQRSGINLFEQRVILNTLRISNISCPDGSLFEFKYEGDARVDEGAGVTAPLSSIEYRKGGLIKAFRFTYKYFFKKQLISLSEGFNKTQDEKRFLRLCLYSIQEIGNNGFAFTPSTEFDYYTGLESSDPKLIVPPIKTFAQDHWGYYSISNQTDFNLVKYPDVPTLYSFLMNPMTYRKPTEGYAKLGMLKKIIFPTGGTKTFEYEQNKNSTGVLGYFGENGCTGGVRVSKIIESASNDPLKNNVTEFSYLQDNGISSGWGFENPVHSSSRTIRYFIQSGGYSYTGDQIIDYSKALRYDHLSSQSYGFSQVFLNAALSAAATGSPGGFIAAGIAIFILIIDPGPDSKDYNSTTYNFTPLNYANIIPNQYSSVTVRKNLSGTGIENGKTVNYFTSPSYYNTSISPLNFPFSPKMRFVPWKYGLAYKIIHYNSNNVKVLEEDNLYNTSLLELAYYNPNYISYKLEPNFIRAFAWPSNVTDNSNITQDIFRPLYGRVELTQKKVRSYGSNGITNETITDYTYDPSNYQLKEMITKNSLGESVGTKIYYPGNYTGITGTALEMMRTQNMINIPLTTVLWKQDFGSSTKKLMQASVTEFGQISNYDIKPVNIYSSELSEPTVSTITDDAAIQNNLTNFSFLKLNSTITYDATGNPIETKAEGNRYSSVIYNYNGRLPVAKITNAKSSEISYTSFEAEGTGNWMFPNTSLTNQQSGITGSFAFNLVSTNTVTSNFYLTANSKYKLSFWVKGSKPVFTAQPPYQTTATITDNLVIKKSVSGWDFYEGEVSTNIVARIILTANGTSSNFIDELRLYPASALMVTTTYAPGIGKTSECDTNNRIVYYQYDELNRLIAVRNENWDIIKAYEYKNKQ